MLLVHMKLLYHATHTNELGILMCIALLETPVCKET